MELIIHEPYVKMQCELCNFGEFMKSAFQLRYPVVF